MLSLRSYIAPSTAAALPIIRQSDWRRACACMSFEHHTAKPEHGPKLQLGVTGGDQASSANRQEDQWSATPPNSAKRPRPRM